MNEIIAFEPNVPVEVALRYATGKKVQGRYGEQYYFTLMDGRCMYLDADVGERIHAQQFRPGEPFTLAKMWNGQRGQPVRWDINRIPPGGDAQCPTTANTNSRSQGCSAAPVAGAAGAFSRRPPQSQTAPPPAPRATGTYGPAPCPALPRSVPGRIPYNVAFREVLHFVTSGLSEAGEQWNDQAKQDLCSTLLIQASKDGFLTVWERGGQS